MGKSCIMAELVSRYSLLYNEEVGGSVWPERFNIAAYHFFLSTDVNARSGELALKSIARQLCSTVPGFRQCLSKTKEELDYQVQKAKGIEELFDVFIRKPCQNLQQKSGILVKPFTIVLDALDECNEAEEFSSAIKNLWDDVPNFVSLIVSSRPATFVQADFNGYSPFFLEPTEKQKRKT